MVQKKPENDAGLLKQYNDLKKKHPDAMLLFREGDFYRMYKEDAVKAAVILGITAANKILPGEKTDMKIAEFAHHSLDTYLPKLIRSGARVAICDRLEDPKRMKLEKESTTQSNNKDMTKKSNRRSRKNLFRQSRTLSKRNLLRNRKRKQRQKQKLRQKPVQKRKPKKPPSQNVSPVNRR